MAKKETKLTKTEIIDRIIKSAEFLIAPITGLLMIWDIDAGVYVAAAAGVIVSVLTFVKLFIKD